MPVINYVCYAVWHILSDNINLKKKALTHWQRYIISTNQKTIKLEKKTTLFLFIFNVPNILNRPVNLKHLLRLPIIRVSPILYNNKNSIDMYAYSLVFYDISNLVGYLMPNPVI